MATKKELYQIGQAGFEATDSFFGNDRAVLAPQEKRYPYYQKEVPLETIPFPYLAFRRTTVSQVPEQLFVPPPPPGPHPNFQFSHLFPAKQQNPPRRRGIPTLGPYQVQYPPQEQYGNRVPAAEATDIDNFKAAQFYGGITSIDYGWF
ncbi:hypothetical protein CDL15_Pgr016714 [Punica granatum]|uniref:Uncharacterized protein n=1 Tax=Punica granatum TaxID=22663 RepID=A0A218XUC1_PUNGR|nr:hypothetical protein CDL15_Pgr016714 [Punica granatum]PKI56733.1 hypothetical protein CRG98_022893 [Punica granatum]